MNNQNQIKCPNCGTSIDVQDILALQLENHTKNENGKLIEEVKTETLFTNPQNAYAKELL